MCVAPGYCAFPDERCDSGYRFHDRGVPEDLVGQCTEPLVEGTSGRPENTGTDASGGTTTSPTTTSTTTTSTTDASTSRSSSTGTPRDCGDRPCACTVEVAAGSQHVCAARLDGQVVCWGRNEVAQLGSGRPSRPNGWPQVVPFPPDVSIDRLVTGNHHSCGRTPGGDSWCWGRNSNQEILLDALVDHVGPTLIPARGPHGALGTAPQHSCFGDADAPGFSCRGDGTNAELGGPPPGPGPQTNTVGVGAAPIDEFAMGRDHSCVRIQDQVWCWGLADGGRLGVDPGEAFSEDPLPVPLPGAATHLVAGRDHTCAVVQGSTPVVCWGDNGVGQIGDDTGMDALVPTPPAVEVPSPIVAASGRFDSTCMLSSNDEIWCWGGDNGASLGVAVEPQQQVSIPMPVDVVAELPEPLVEIALGNNSLCGRAASMRLWCWGGNENQQLGPADPPRGMATVELDVECPPGIGR